MDIEIKTLEEFSPSPEEIFKGFLVDRDLAYCRSVFSEMEKGYLQNQDPAIITKAMADLGILVESKKSQGEREIDEAVYKKFVGIRDLAYVREVNSKMKKAYQELQDSGIVQKTLQNLEKLKARGKKGSGEMGDDEPNPKKPASSVV